MAIGPHRLHAHINRCLVTIFITWILYSYVPLDEYENYSSPVAAATTFLCRLVSSRTKATFLPILGFVNSVLEAHPASPQRFGALNMLSALSPFAMRHPEVKHKMEGFTLQHILPEFTAQEGYMRAVVRDHSGTRKCCR
jgi:hypothetical protein